MSTHEAESLRRDRDGWRRTAEGLDRALAAALAQIETLRRMPEQVKGDGLVNDGTNREHRIYDSKGRRVSEQWRLGWNDCRSVVLAVVGPVDELSKT